MKRYFKWILPVTLIVLIEVIKFFPGVIEKWYSLGIYPFIGVACRTLFGWIPFSIGDLSVAILCSTLIYKIIRVVRERKNVPLKRGFLAFGKKLLLFGLWMYAAFYALWGLNYYRLGSSYLMGIEPGPYTTQEVDTLVNCLQQKIAVLCRDSLSIDRAKTNDRNKLRDAALESYHLASTHYPFMQFSRSSLKPNLLGALQSYTGYAGYLFPFTGEAHANFYGPKFTLPFTVCHEMAHQLGFGSESEANLVGFLAARESRDKAFEYSAFAGVHQYALAELFVRDSLVAKKYIDSQPTYLRRDKMELRKFVMEHSSIMQPVLNITYHLYLLGNNQPEGLESYNYVVAWLIAFGKKFGWEAI